MKAIVDCNSFYCSCERLFKPHLDNKPVVVLSNNDACIISRSDEAKALGVGMAGPYFLAKPLIEKHNVATFSSNYNLYGDLSWRVMETLRILLGEENVEVYSVDEAFLELGECAQEDLQKMAENILDTVEMWTGIKVSIGVAPTKVLAKVANRLSKKDKSVKCVLVLDTEEKIIDALYKTPIQDVWGVGHQYSEKLREMHAIYTALDLSKRKEDWAKIHLGGVVGVRLLEELKGECISKMEEALTNKKIIATTRMFGNPVSTITEIKEAVATYTSRAAEKLRRQHSAANVISVFVVPKEANMGQRFSHGPSVSSYTTLPFATAATHELIKPALQLVDKLFEKGRHYKKAGVTLSGLVPDNTIQGNLFIEESNNGKRLLMNTLDNVNFAMRDDMVKFAASGTTRNWKMRQEMRSPRYTSRWDELKTVS
ncbi:Y-family DNA polymerase [Ferruginibacter sp.]|uniref:Y-family DNA polymerase n=1 Tax=Ferruginibacter sp. TaxID=1940288 RepID=UPI002659A426|nr:Y-family DNA polymerase [Ferruginibacter sp.]